MNDPFPTSRGEHELEHAAPPSFEVEDRSLGEELLETAPPPAAAEKLQLESLHDAPTRPNYTLLADDE